MEGAQFINMCIKRKPDTRLGVNGIAELKQHVWFRDFDWQALAKRTLDPPFKPPNGLNIDKKKFISEK